mmetsp:Transcript_16094/g.23685  ORF Transcript_16094/g.23685 Transcript_16094/m.23685 type:complete len:193 (-) Transcript_16094:63-641(-)
MVQKRKHGVHFSETDLVFTIDRLSNPSEIWYSSEEFSMIQHSWVASVRKIGSERGSDKGIAYAQDLLSVYNNSMCTANRPCCPKSIARLAQWSDRRGLEFHSVHTIQRERTRQRTKVRGAVIELQRQLREQGIRKQGDVLARVASALAVPAKSFARTMGETDAIAAIESNLLASKGSFSPVRPKKRIRISVA